MPNFAGFDRGGYPGDAAMQAIIQNTNLSWCGFYLAPAPSHPDRSWMAKRAFLQGLGFGLAPIYVGQQVSGPGSHIVTAAQGTIDGQDAAQLATKAGFGPGSIVFLDVEQGPPVQPQTIAYCVAWVAALIANGCAPGVYCSHSGIAQALFNADNRPVFWVFNINAFTCVPSEVTAHRVLIPRDPPFPTPDPATSGVPFAKLLQFAQSNQPTKCGIRAGGLVVTNVDFDSSVASDPSNSATYP
jgi:hypothetical protein